MTNIYEWTDNPTVAGISLYDPDVLNDCLMHLKYNHGNIPVGTIFPCVCSKDWTPENALAVDGSEYSSGQFPTLWTDFLTATTPKLATCTYEQYASDIETYGQCAKFAVDTENNKFKVPTIKDGSYITQAMSDAEIGKAYNESLPNIKGEFIPWAYQGNYETGAFDSEGTLYLSYNSQGVNTGKKVTFDASRSSSTYQDNAKVQGDNVRLRWFVVVATGTTSQSAMDWSAWATSLEGKLNADHTNDTKPYVKTTYENGTSGYRIWSDGYCEQWGIVTGANGELVTTTFLKVFNVAPIVCVNFTFKIVGNVNYIYIQARNVTTTSFQINTYQDNCDGTMWRACGYLAAGQY